MSATLDSDGVMTLRREIYTKPCVTRSDFSSLLAAGRAAGAAASQDYADLLSEVASDLIVNQVDPPKYVSQGDADWFIAQVGQGGGLSCRAEFKMLVDVLRYAVSVPASLACFAVSEIEKAVVEGHRAANGEADHAAKTVTHDDVEALRTAVFAATDGSSLHVTKASAESLFRMAHAMPGANQETGFDDLFARAIGNYLLGIAHRWTPSAAEELTKEKWLDDKAPAFGAFLGSLFGGGQRQVASVDDLVEREFRFENDADASAMAKAGGIDAGEADWLLDHLTRDGPLTSAEMRLLRFLKDEASELPASLTAVINRQAA